jgi:hypothetical protein
MPFDDREGHERRERSCIFRKAKWKCFARGLQAIEIIEARNRPVSPDPLLSTTSSPFPFALAALARRGAPATSLSMVHSGP